MKFFLQMLTLLGSLSLVSCSSQIFLKSSPDGIPISVYDSKTKAYQKAGTTPLNLRPLLNASQEGLLQIRLDHPSKLPTYMAVPTDISGDLELMVQLSERSQFEEDLQEVTTVLYQIRAEMVKNNLSEAENRLSTLKQKYGYLAVIYLYQAELDILKQDKTSAVQSLQRALDLSPDNPAAAALLQNLKKL